MTTQTTREIRLLRSYVTISVPVLIVLMLGAFVGKANRPHFEEISVERINVVEPDGTLKLVISNSARQTETTIGGEPLPVERTRPAGLIFFNDIGDEIGGLIFGGDPAMEGGGSFTFDQAGHDQVVQLINREWTDATGQRRRQSGLRLGDFPPDQTLLDLTRLRGEAEAIEDPVERERALAELRKAGVLGAARMFVGRTVEGQAGIIMRDGQGVARLHLSVEESGAAVIEFLDSEGNVIRKIGPTPE